MATSQNIEDMKLPELKQLAKQMGLRGTSTMRKPDLIATLQAARNGGQAPEGVTVKAAASPASSGADTQAAEHAGRAAKSTEAGASAAPAHGADDKDLPSDGEGNGNQPFEVRRRQRTRPTADSSAATSRSGRSENRSDSASAGHDGEESQDSRQTKVQPDTLLDQLDLDLPESQGHGRSRQAIRSDRDGNDRCASKNEGQGRRTRRIADDDLPRRRRRNEGQSRHAEEEVRDLDDILSALPDDEAQQQSSHGEGSSADHGMARRGRGHEHANGADRYGNRRMRGRDRDRDYDYEDRSEREGRHDSHREEADLVPVAGIIDVLDSYAFVRTSGYLPGPNDVYVSMGQIKRYSLRKGDAVQGYTRPPREGDRRNQRQKFVPLHSIETINGMSVEEAAGRQHFSKLTPLYPQERLSQESAPNNITGRLIDIVSPIGKGQRGLIVSPPKAGKTITLQNIANAISTNNPEVHLMVVLVDERPEEVTDMERTVQGEVISSTFDRPASDHTTVAELAIERAKRLVELGQDVVVLLDSMTRLARAYNIAAPTSGRILSGGVDAQALYPPKKFFGAARNIENGGSLTIISSALVETGSKMDEVIFEEFKGTGNMELRLSRELADKRLFPAIDVNASGTRREELITPKDELPIIYRLRRLLGGLEPEQAYQTLVPRLKKTSTNRDFLAAIIQQSGN
ncbi:transcription termination factor Rho [Bifidobacterium aemilianum]|uniref:Transcription termination factor Rho n=1 Tax=Bifidobacterium aemilianum TaxID=2493120 RepID=A0A366K8W7_9BIFI|nr:transcription termination factor Rho [Bifidobacterium aemilianum]RBP97692.1 transcription termination factor Rho [Bifidobacterium aemilianum]